MNQIASTPYPPPKNIKIFLNFFYILMMILKKLFQGVRLATLSFNKYNMAQGLLRRSCFKYVNIMKKLPLPLPSP